MNMKIIMKPLRNSEYSKSDNFKKLPVPAQVFVSYERYVYFKKEWTVCKFNPFSFTGDKL